MNEAVYIVICHIPSYHKPQTIVDIFATLPKAQRFKERMLTVHENAQCDIYTSYKQ